jgi:hypothetical protein
LIGKIEVRRRLTYLEWLGSCATISEEHNHDNQCASMANTFTISSPDIGSIVANSDPLDGLRQICRI